MLQHMVPNRKDVGLVKLEIGFYFSVTSGHFKWQVPLVLPSCNIQNSILQYSEFCLNELFRFCCAHYSQGDPKPMHIHTCCAAFELKFLPLYPRPRFE